MTKPAPKRIPPEHASRQFEAEIDRNEDGYSYGDYDWWEDSPFFDVTRYTRNSNKPGYEIEIARVAESYIVTVRKSWPCEDGIFEPEPLFVSEQPCSYEDMRGVLCLYLNAADVDPTAKLVSDRGLKVPLRDFKRNKL